MTKMQDNGQLFSELYDVHPQAIVWLQPIWSEDETTITDFEFSYCNDEGLNYLNLTREQQKGLRVSVSPTVTDELRDQFMAEMIRVYQTGEKTETNIYNPALNKYARVLRTRLRNGILTVVQERTEENRIIKKLEQQTEQLQTQKNLLDNLLRHSPAGITITEVIRDEEGHVVDGRTVLANDPGFEYEGMPKSEVPSRTIREVDPALMGSPLYQMALNTLQTGEPFHTQYFFEPTGRWLELSVAKMDEDHLINVFMDITHTKAAQLRQQQLLEELQRTNANLEEFAYAASHDLQEPLRKIYTFSDRLKHGLASQLNESQKKMFERIEAATQRMRNLIEDLLGYSQLSVQPNTHEEVALNDIVQQVVQDLETSIAETGTVVRVGKLAQVKGDGRQLRQMFQNLIGNAIKYHKENVTPEVSVTGRKAQANDPSLVSLPEGRIDNHYLIEVKDNGIGFEQAHAEKIFQVFQRLHGRAEYEGTGVGLAIVQKVVTNHKGYIWAESEPGKGAAFRVLLPL